MATDYAVLKRADSCARNKKQLLFKTSCSRRKSYGKTAGKDC